jgi:hypothetical protein
MKFYLAYGMNTNLSSMARRCPNAVSLGKVWLDDHILTFKTHADAEYYENGCMECALWKITEVCEQSLDSLEGFPYYYEKKMVDVVHEGELITAMIYYMREYYPLRTPDQYYLNTLVQGYHQHDMDKNEIYRAYEETLNLDIIDIEEYN